MLFQKDEILATLPSNSSMETYPDNKPQSFKTKLQKPLEFHGEWEVALVDLTYPHNWFNLRENPIISFLEGSSDESADLKSGIWLDIFNSAAPTTMKAKSVYRWPVRIKQGYYSNPGDLIDTFQELSSKKYSDWKLIRKQVDAGRLSRANPNDMQLKAEMDKLENTRQAPCPIIFRYNKIHNSISIEGENVVMVIEKNNQEILNALGIQPENENNMFTYQYLPIYNKKPPYLHPWTSIYIYSDIIEPQMVGDSLVKLLNTCPIMGQNGEYSHWNFNPLHFIPLSRGYINTIAIELKTDTGEFLPITSGKVVCRLRFRERKPR